METVLVTGGAGSMGRLVVNQLIAKNYLVKVFDLPQANFDGFDEFCEFDEFSGFNGFCEFV